MRLAFFFYSATTTSSTSETCPAFSKVSSSRDFLAQNFRLAHEQIHSWKYKGGPYISPLLALAVADLPCSSCCCCSKVWSVRPMFWYSTIICVVRSTFAQSFLTRIYKNIIKNVTFICVDFFEWRKKILKTCFSVHSALTSFSGI